MKTLNEMAFEAGFTEGELAFMGDNFIRFAELVRSAAKTEERKECAREIDIPYFGEGGKECAYAIRARGNT